MRLSKFEMLSGSKVVQSMALLCGGVAALVEGPWLPRDHLELGAQGIRYRAWCTGHRAWITEHGAQSIVHRAYGTGHTAQSMVHRI